MAECPGRQEEISALIDGELTPAEELALRRHLDDCPGCAAWRACLEALSSGVDRSLARERAPRALDQRMSRLAPPSRLPGPVAGVLATLMALALASAHPGTALPEADLLQDHERLVATGARLAAPSGDPAEVARTLAERLPFRIEVAQVPGARLRGGHACTIRGHRAAYLQYELEAGGIASRAAQAAPVASAALGDRDLDHGRVSVFVFSDRDVPAALAAGEAEVPCRRLGRLSVCAFAARDQVVGVVAESPEAARSFRRAARLVAP